LTQLSGELLTAFSNHTLTFQNSAYVPGLDLSETSWVTQNGSVEHGSGVALTYNHAFVDDNPDGKQHALITIGDIGAYLTW
jgi:hypothetical protein